MKIDEFISMYKNHPVLFIGTGISLRYLKKSFTWDGLLKHVSNELKGNCEFYLDIKSNCEYEGKFNYAEIASKLEEAFNAELMKNRSGPFVKVNDAFYQYMEREQNVSRFKIYISDLLKDFSHKEEMENEIAEFKKVRKNIGSIITTNYDEFVESLFEFEPLIGNDILLSNPYGAVYKIHGCVQCPEKIILTKEDYEYFDVKYELIRAQLLSLFIHNPIIFLGYGIGDDNIKSILKTLFTYVEPNSSDADRIRKNFLLVEYEKDSSSQEICEHDIDMEGFSTIRINKIKTDDYISIYKCISSLNLPISAMDVRKVQSIVKEIYSGGKISVNITEDWESLANADKVIAIGSSKTIKYTFQTTAEMMSNYFSIIEESNEQLLLLINKHKIQKGQFFPIFGFESICKGIVDFQKLKKQQLSKIKVTLDRIPKSVKNTTHKNIADIFEDDLISATNKVYSIIWSVNERGVSLEDFETYLRNHEEKVSTDYRKMLCLFDKLKYYKDTD